MLQTIELDLPPSELTFRVSELLKAADSAIERFIHDRRDRPVAAFVPSDFVLVWQALDQISELSLASGGRFLEWGSGIGAATCLASLAGFDAIGIEIEDELVEDAQELAEDQHIDAEFVCGSFVPPEGVELLDDEQGVTWLRSDGDDAYDWLGLTPDDFDLIFSYPWPGEEAVVFRLFERFAATGALLLTYHGHEGVRLVRKVRKKRR